MRLPTMEVILNLVTADTSPLPTPTTVSLHPLYSVCICVRGHQFTFSILGFD